MTSFSVLLAMTGVVLGVIAVGWQIRRIRLAERDGSRVIRNGYETFVAIPILLGIVGLFSEDAFDTVRSAGWEALPPLVMMGVLSLTIWGLFKKCILRLIRWNQDEVVVTTYFSERRAKLSIFVVAVQNGDPAIINFNFQRLSFVVAEREYEWEDLLRLCHERFDPTPVLAND